MLGSPAEQVETKVPPSPKDEGGWERGLDTNTPVTPRRCITNPPHPTTL